MSAERRFTPRPAFEIPAGNAVRRRTDDGVLCLKGQRQAKRYVQDYLVAIAPMAADGPRLEFVDPETELADGGAPLDFVPGPESVTEEGARPRPQAGDLVRSERGMWLAVSETNGLHTFVSFIDVATGDVRRLRDGAILAVHRDWRLAESDDNR